MFKFPALNILHNQVPSFVKEKNIPVFSFHDIKVLKSLGAGSFGDVLLVSDGSGKPTVVKKIKDEDNSDPRLRRLFFKEATILHDLCHSNIVKVLGLCNNPCALKMEYLCFDFEPFGSPSCKVSSLDQFLNMIDDHDLVDQFPFQHVIASNIAKGLEYLHEKNFAHRDLKPGNVLVSNNHYSGLHGTNLQEAFSRQPIICKLTDFGESRSEAVQTATLCHQGTANVYRGSPVYMAPEILLPDTDFSASICDLKSVDIWALGMVFFMILNPDLDYPYLLEIKQSKKMGLKWKDVVHEKMRNKQLPLQSKKYHMKQASDWYTISAAFERCLSFDSNLRPNAREVCQLLARSDFSLHCRDIPLSCSQSSAVAEGNIENDATNSCTILSVLLADMLIKDGDELPTEIDEWEELAHKAEDLITNAPRKFNKLRDVNKKYDVLEAYKLLRADVLIQSPYEYTEEILLAQKLYSPEGRCALLKGVRRLSEIDEMPQVGIYTGGEYTFLIGYKDGRYFLIDTHSISKELGGNGNGILKVFLRGNEDAPERLCSWVWKRLKQSGVKPEEHQSFAIAEASGLSKSLIPPVGSKRPGVSSEDLNPKRKKTLCSDGKRQDEIGRKEGAINDQDIRSFQDSGHRNVRYDDNGDDDGDDINIDERQQHNPIDRRGHNDYDSGHRNERYDENNDDGDDINIDERQQHNPVDRRGHNDYDSGHRNGRYDENDDDGDDIDIDERQQHNPIDRRGHNDYDSGHRNGRYDENDDDGDDIDIDERQQHNPIDRRGHNDYDSGHRNERYDENDDDGDDIDSDEGKQHNPVDRRGHNDYDSGHRNGRYDENDDDGDDIDSDEGKQHNPIRIPSSSDENEDGNERKNTCHLGSYIKGCPVYSRQATGLSMLQILNICIGQNFSEDKICKQIPKTVTEDAIFVVDLSAVDYKDLTSDDHGIYGSHSSPSQRVQVQLSEKGEVLSFKTNVSKEERGAVSANDIFVVRRHYSWHNLNGMARTVIKVQNKDDFMKYAIIQYKSSKYTTGKVVSIHGNSKKKKEQYVRTRPTVMAKIREYGKTETPKHVIQKIQMQAGGAIGLESKSDIPRDRQQVYCAVQKVPGKAKHRNTGPAKAVKYGELITLMNTGSFVKDVSFSVKSKRVAYKTLPNTFAATDTQLLWMKTFCDGQSPRSQIGIDMTYNVGSFYVTALTFPHPMFVYKRHELKHPTMFLGMMTSSTRDSSDYEYLASNLKKRDVHTLTYGTDGEQALERGFENVYPIENVSNKCRSIHLRCFEHVKQDLLRTMKELNIAEDKQRDIVKQILGFEVNGVRTKGLVDADENEYEAALQQLRKTLPGPLYSWLISPKGRIRPLSETIKNCMLKSVRVSAGLGNPPKKYDNQRSEALNTVIKEEAKKEAVNQVNIHEILESRIVQPQREELVKAIYGVGEYRLAKDFEHLSKEFTEWAKMTSEQKECYVNKVLHHKPQQPKTADVSMPKVFEALNIETRMASVIGKTQAQKVLREALVLKEDSKIISLQNDKFCITEKENAFVVERKSTKSFFCNCKYFQKHRLVCAHVVLVVNEKGELDGFVKKLEADPNLPFKVMTDNLPSQRGQKPGAKKRRGKNNIQSSPLVDLQEVPPSMPSQRFTEYYHNDEPFKIVFIKDYPKAKQCEGCKTAIPRRFFTPPFDIMFLHEERYEYPEKDANGKFLRMQVTRAKMAKRFYCLKEECVLTRHPYFWTGRISTSKEVKMKLRPSHVKYLQDTLLYKP